MNKLFIGISAVFLVASFILNLQLTKAGQRIKIQKEKYADTLNFKERFLDPGEWTGDTAERAKLNKAATYADKAKLYHRQSNKYFWIIIASYFIFLLITFFFSRRMDGAGVLPLGITVLALACLHIGLTYPMLEITALERDLDIGALPIKTNVMGFNVDLNIEQVFEGDMIFYYQSKSVLELVQTLLAQKNWVVGISILAFSILIPLMKLLFTSVLLFGRGLSENKLMTYFVRYAGKWSMADVFVVAVFLAFLAFSNMQVGITTESNVLLGLYFFLGYCVLSIWSSQLILNKNA